MSKQCQRCGHLNEDARYFCQQCGEPLDSDVKLLLDYEKMKKEAPRPQTRVRDDQDDDYIPTKQPKQKKSHAGMWIALVCLVAVCAAGVYLFLFAR